MKSLCMHTDFGIPEFIGKLLYTWIFHMCKRSLNAIILTYTLAVAFAAHGKFG